MRDIFYNQTHKIGSHDWLIRLTEAEKSEWDWIQNNIEQPDEVVITGRKESYAKDKASGTPNILIDDRPANIQRWQGAGGYGILYQANRDSLTKIQQALDQYGKSNQS